MNHLVIDQGNSFLKGAFFSDGKMMHHFIIPDEGDDGSLSELLNELQPTAAIFSSVRKEENLFARQIRESGIRVIVLGAQSKLPFHVDYNTPETLGSDRLANVAGALKRFPLSNVLVVDCGTCLTYSVAIKGVFVGGAISPGIEMRLKALNHYTGRLPLVQHQKGLPDMIGKSTEDSIRAGAERGALIEVENMIEQFCSENADLNVLLTGGGMSFFEPHLKSPIFAAPYLTLEGLHEILLIN